MSAITGAIGGLVGGIAGMSSERGDKERAEMDIDRARGRQVYNTDAAGVAGNAYDKVDPVSRDAMLQAMADYENKARSGGLDAVAQANLEATQARAAQGGRQTAAQIQQNAQRHGAAQGPASMVAQQVAQQQEGQNARLGAVQSAALAEQARNEALKGVVGTAGNVYGMDANKAAAANQIAEFNVNNSQQNIHNKAHQADMLSGIDTRSAGMYEGRANQDIPRYAGAGKAIGSNVGALAGGMGGWGGGGGAGLPTDAEGTGMGG